MFWSGLSFNVHSLVIVFNILEVLEPKIRLLSKLASFFNILSNSFEKLRPCLIHYVCFIRTVSKSSICSKSTFLMHNGVHYIKNVLFSWRSRAEKRAFVVLVRIEMLQIPKICFLIVLKLILELRFHSLSSLFYGNYILGIGLDFGRVILLMRFHSLQF